MISLFNLNVNSKLLMTKFKRTVGLQKCMRSIFCSPQIENNELGSWRIYRGKFGEIEFTKTGFTTFSSVTGIRGIRRFIKLCTGQGVPEKNQLLKKSSKNILKPAKLWNREKSVILKLDKWTRTKPSNGAQSDPVQFISWVSSL